MDILIERLKNDETLALDMIIDKYSDYIYTVVKNFSGRAFSEQDIEEIISDVFILLWKNRVIAIEVKGVTYTRQ